MELSELINWNEKVSIQRDMYIVNCTYSHIFTYQLYSIDDKTGEVYEISKSDVTPLLKLVEGDGTPGNKPFKGENMTTMHIMTGYD